MGACDRKTRDTELRSAERVNIVIRVVCVSGISTRIQLYLGGLLFLRLFGEGGFVVRCAAHVCSEFSWCFRGVSILSVYF